MSDRATIRYAGDAAILLQLAPVIDPHVNGRVVAIADAIRRRQLYGVRSVVPTFRSVAVYFDPLDASEDEIAAVLEELATARPAVVGGRSHEIPVSYGGDDGPDLAEVAARANLSASEVIQRHSGVPYRVFMLGFQPGFGYMGLIDERLATPRRATPRLKVPAGSVAIAGRQTGVYPSQSPGGWQILGRALEPVFDWQRLSARFAPGDTVTFVPSLARSNASLPTEQASASDVRGPRVTVISPGLFTTVQDGGNWEQQAIGMPVSGPMDTLSHRTANMRVGNAPGAAALEVTLSGPELRFEQGTSFAVAGADLSATIDGRPVSRQSAMRAAAGSVLKFGNRVAGARAYVAFEGGLELRSRWPVRHLAAGSSLAIAASGEIEKHRSPASLPLPTGDVRLRVLPGPQDDELPPGCLETLLATRFTVSPQSNRMGYRLTGGKVPSDSGEMISDATFTGGIQVPPSGEPILLMADRQTTGGYPQVATVISADLPLAGQLAPGDRIAFVACSRAEARAALLERYAVVRDGC